MKNAVVWIWEWRFVCKIKFYITTKDTNKKKTSL